MLDWPTVVSDDFLHQLVSGSLPSQGWRFNVGEHWKPWELIQEAQLSQRDCATLRVIEYFAKSLTVTQDHWK